MFSEDDLLPLSGLQHLAFCERQWALIHIEQQWTENSLTAEGRVVHERAHEPGAETRKTLVIARGVAVHSFRLGISGQADVVEFNADTAGIVLDGRAGRWRPSPVEYKRGRPKRMNCDRVQVCAQGLCLEEMYGIRVTDGALYYDTPRRREDVVFTSQLRAQTERLCARMHELYQRRETPHPVYTRGCENCSLKTMCLPRVLGSRRDVKKYLEGAVQCGNS